MNHTQCKAYAVVETDGTPHKNGGTVHTVEEMAELSSRRPSAPAPRVWNQTIDCEARNALQVILSGSEILLDNACRSSCFDQKAMLERILASARQLNSIIATLTRPDEIIGEIFFEDAGPRELHVMGSKLF